MNQLLSLIRHSLTGLAGLGTYLATVTPVDPATVDQVNKAGADLVDPLAGLLALVAMIAVRLLISALGKVFPSLGERLGNAASGGMSGGASVLLISMAAAVGGLLPSCKTLSKIEEIAREYPATASIYYRDPKSGAKAGLTATPGKPTVIFGRVAVLDPDTGEVIGWTDLSIPVGKEDAVRSINPPVNATK